jgi:hypothetical protein
MDTTPDTEPTPMTDKIVEAVARALCLRYLKSWYPDRSDEKLAETVERQWREHVPTAQTAISAHSAALKEAGTVMVPVEPTEAMCDFAAFADVPWEFVDTRSRKRVKGPFALEISGPNQIKRAKLIVAHLYRAMISQATKEQ